MTEHGDKALLPAGLQDVLPPQAGQEAAVVERLIACFEGYGYERVKPPILEFEETLLTGAGTTLAPQTFRLMDPVSQRMMGLRADMTPQIARIAATRLSNAPRPLRLCYGGQVLQVKGSQLRPDRQFGQVGAELIGASEERADAEVVLLAVEALTGIGVQGLSVDLNLPTLIGTLASSLGMDKERFASLRQALDRKDIAAVAEIAGSQAAPFTDLLSAAGPAEKALGTLAGLALADDAANEFERLARVVDLIRDAAPELTLTVDPVEQRGFEYQTGVSFILFARGVRGELGRGGRYSTDGPASAVGGLPESSTGFTLFMDTVQRALPEPEVPRRLYLPAGCDPSGARTFRKEGWITLAGLDSVGDDAAEARRLGCSHALVDGRVVELKD